MVPMAELRPERRWPPGLALLLLTLMPLLLPGRLTMGPGWLLPVACGALFVTVAATSLAGDRRGSRVVRRLSLVLIGALVVGAVWSTVRLIDDLVHDGTLASSPAELLSSGALVWVNNNIIFGLLYWELDGGGPARRGLDHRPPDFAFPQTLDPALAAPGWRPTFVDYLYLGLTNALAFSPTDAMPLVPWAKLTMALQSLISVSVLSLVIARAVNVLT
jgi:hypothetical protein